MDKNIGIKGQGNDYQKTLTRKEKVAKKTKESLEAKKELEELEKKVKKAQAITFVKAIPIVLTGKTVETLLNVSKKDIEKKLFLPTSSAENYKKTSYLTTDNKNNIVEVTITTDKNFPKKTIKKSEDKEPLLELEETEDNKEKLNIPIINQEVHKKLEKLKDRRIIVEYETSLKDARVSLRNLFFEYKVLEDQEKNSVDPKTVQELLEGLNSLITKIEKLKDTIKIKNIEMYDDNYIYTLIEGYIEEFKNKKEIFEIKDSPLYILISEKIEELNKKSEKLNTKIETKKEKLKLDNKSFDDLKDKYNDFESLNNKLTNFQKEQELLLKEIAEKIENATTSYEKVEAKVEGMSKQSKNLLRFMSLQMLLPGARSTKGLINATALTLYYMKNITKPKVSTRKYKVIEVTDYSKEIESSITSLDNIINLINKTSKQIDNIIADFEKEFKDYFGEIKECDELLADLQKVKESIKEKEYELNKIKDIQEINLAKNNNKVKIKE